MISQTRHSSADFDGDDGENGRINGTSEFEGSFPFSWTEGKSSRGCVSGSRGGRGVFKQTKACSKHVQTIGRTKSQLKTEEPYISEIYIEIYICVIYIYIVKKCVIYIFLCVR